MTRSAHAARSGAGGRLAGVRTRGSGLRTGASDVRAVGEVLRQPELVVHARDEARAVRDRLDGGHARAHVLREAALEDPRYIFSAGEATGWGFKGFQIVF